MAPTQRKKFVVGAAAVIFTVILDRRRAQRGKEKRVWTRPWITLREKHGAYHCLLKELRMGDKPSYKNFLRMDETSFDELLSKVEPLIKKQDTHLRDSISAAERLALTLRFLASGDSFSSLQYLYWIPKITISRIVPEVCEAIYQVLVDDYLKTPTTTEEWEAKAQEFAEKWQFFNCIGAIDGKHVVVQAPENSGSYYFNYKGTFSIVLLALVDADYKFTYVDVGQNGRCSDGGVYKGSSLSKALEAGDLQITSKCQLPGTNKLVPHVFVGDDAFPLSTSMMKPYKERVQLTKEQQIFNYRLSRARRIVENAFGILANRFRVFMKPIALEPRKVETLVLACVTLHNFLRTKPRSRHLYAPRTMFDSEDTNNGDFTDGSWRPKSLKPGVIATQPEPRGLIDISAGLKGRQLDKGKEVRNVLCDHFNSEAGAVPWQEKMVKTGIEWK